MRKLILWNMVTIDGLFEGPKSWDLDWHEYAWGEEMEQLSIEQLTSADLLLFGRVTYVGMAAYWPIAQGKTAELMNGIPKIVFSRTLDAAGWSNTRLVKSEAAEEVRNLKAKPGRDILIFGSGKLCSSLVEEALIDEFRLGVNPLILGNGTPLFPRGRSMTKMRLLEAKPTKTGIVILRYEPER